MTQKPRCGIILHILRASPVLQPLCSTHLLSCIAGALLIAFHILACQLTCHELTILGSQLTVATKIVPQPLGPVFTIRGSCYDRPSTWSLLSNFELEIYRHCQVQLE